MRAGWFVLKKAAARSGMEGEMKKKRKGKKGRILESSGKESSESESDSKESSEQEQQKVKKKSGGREVRTRKVQFQERDVKDEVEELTSQLHALDMRDSAYTSTYACLVIVAPTLAERVPLPARWTIGVTTTGMTGVSAPIHNSNPIAYSQSWPYNDTCYFCKGRHQIRVCDTAADGYYAHADGTQIIHHPDGLKAVVDHKRSHDHPPHMPTPPTAFSSFVSA